MSEPVNLRIDGDCAIVTLNNPRRGNALGPELVGALGNALDAAADQGAAVMVLDSEGKHFCTGVDLADVEQLNDDVLLDRFVAIEALLARVWSAPFLTVAVGRGRVMGAGADLFAACNYRLALQGSSYAFPGAAFGLVLGTRRLAVRVGPDVAMDLALSDRSVPADEARALGLASAVLDVQALEAALERIRQTARRCAPETVRDIKCAAFSNYQGLDQDLASLTESARRPGLQERIVAHKNRVLG
ncbi:MAG: enoyl-CoA hydratase/isomerase family protein [Aquisalimonadaceae bacterium]